MLRDKFTTEKCTLFEVLSLYNNYFVTQGDPGGRGATGDLGTGGEMVRRCYCQKK